MINGKSVGKKDDIEIYSIAVLLDKIAPLVKQAGGFSDTKVIGLDEKFREHLDIDELDFVEMVMDIEKLFNFCLPDDQLNEIEEGTVRDLIILIQKQLN